MISKTTTRLTVLLVLILGGVLLFAQQPLALAAPQLHGNTPTPAPEEEHDDTTEAEAANDHAETAEAPTLETLAARIAALEAEVAALHTGHAGAQTNTNEVTTAIYLLDNAGLHDLDERLNGEGTIESSDSGRVARVARLLASVTWPQALATAAMSTTVVLNDLAAALADDDLANAAPLATTAHDVGHELSHAAEHWLGDLGTEAGDHDAAGQAFRVTSAIYLLDNAGLHDLDVRLNEAQDLQSGDAGKVERVARLLATVDWPEALATTAMSVTTTLDELAVALADDDLAAAAPLATVSHEVAHDLSHAAEHWLDEALGAAAHDDEASDDHADTPAADDHADEGEDDHSDSSGG